MRAAGAALGRGRSDVLRVDSWLRVPQPLTEAGVRCQSPAPSGARGGHPCPGGGGVRDGPLPVTVFLDVDLSWIGKLPLYRSQALGPF